MYSGFSRAMLYQQSDGKLLGMESRQLLGMARQKKGVLSSSPMLPIAARNGPQSGPGMGMKTTCNLSTAIKENMNFLIKPVKFSNTRTNSNN